MVAKVVRQDVVAGIVQDLVFREEVDLESAEVRPRFEVSWIPVTIARHRVVADE